MASTVFANGKAVATTKTPHMARSEPHDERLVNKTKKTALPNYIESEFLTRQLPELTEFNSGKIWVFPSECGLPPPSKPADGWPGAHNGMQVNSYAKAAAGEGSINVFVEGDKVIRHTDKTKQNAGNSDGIIDDLANLQAYLDKFKTQETAAPPATAKGGGDAKKPKGATTADEGREEEPPKVDDKGKPPVNPECVIDGVLMVEKQRQQFPTDAAAGDAKLEVLANDVVELTATAQRVCGEHPVWIPPEGQRGVKKAVMKFSYTTGSNRAWSTLFGPFGWFLIFDAKPEEYAIICRDHNRGFSRLIRSFPKDQVEITRKFDREPKKKIDKELGTIFKMLPVKFTFKLERPQIAIIANAGWSREKAWRCRCDGKVGARGTFFKFSAEVRVELYKFAPGAGQVMTALNAVFQYLTGSPLGTIYGFFRAAATAGVDITGNRRKWYGSEPTWSALEGLASGRFSFEAGLGGALAKDVVKVEGFAATAANIEGVALAAQNDLVLGLRVQFEKLKLVFTISWDVMSLLKYWTGKIPFVGQWVQSKAVDAFQKWLDKNFGIKLMNQVTGELVLLGPSNKYPLAQISLSELMGAPPGSGPSLEH